MSATPPPTNVPSTSGTTFSSKPKVGSWRPFDPSWIRKKQKLQRTIPIVIPLPLTIQNQPVNRDEPSTSSSNANNLNTNQTPSRKKYHSFLLDQQSPNEPYPSWKLYFSNEKYTPDSSIVRKIRNFEMHFKSFPEKYNLLEIFSNYCFNINLNFIQNDTKFTESWSNFYTELIEFPQITLSAAGMAMHTLCAKCSEIQNEINCDKKLVQKRTPFKIFRARLEDFTPISCMSAIRHRQFETLISIRGTVIHVGDSVLISSWTTFKCSLCEGLQVVKQDDGIITQPNACQTTGCNNKSKFDIEITSPYNRMEKFQKIRVQQLVTIGNEGDEIKQIKQIEVEMLNEFVDNVGPGEDIVLVGIIKVHLQEDNNKQQNDGIKLYLQAVTIVKEKSFQHITKMTEKDLQVIQMIKEEPSPFRLLVQSLCPSIFGHEIVKAGLVLALIGGRGNNYGLRSEIHVLMVGDPGVGKSEMLKSCSQISAKEVLVSGCGSTIAGLTVTVNNRKDGGEVTGGALVLADGAHCCIDEFDKTRANQQAVLEVMEQQSIAIAKAGVYCTVPARTSILAAANPCSGSYDYSKTILENLKMDSPLLSRFDLIFIMLDKNDENFDNMMIKHVQGYLSKSKVEPTEYSYRGNSRNESANSSTSIPIDNNDLENRLRLKQGEHMDLLSKPLMQRYIAYARKNCAPEISDEAGRALQAFYIQLRQMTINSNLIPITARQFEGLLRLTQARARADLANEATIEHAMDVISIFQHGMRDVFIAQSNPANVSNASGSKSRKSNATQVKDFLALIHHASRIANKHIFNIIDLQEIASLKGLEDNISYLVDSLNNQGYLLKKSANVYQFNPQ